MSQVIDLRKNPIEDASKHIVSIINNTAKMKQAQNEIQKNLMLDELKRSRDRQDKQLERHDEESFWAKQLESEFGSSSMSPGSTGSMQGGGMQTLPANGQYPGIAQNLPGSPNNQVQTPFGGYSPSNPPPMSYADPARQAEGQLNQAQQVQQTANQGQIQKPQDVIYNGIRLPSAMEVAISMRRAGQKPNIAKLKIYDGAFKAAQSGQASEETMRMMLGFLGFDKKKTSAEPQLTSGQRLKIAAAKSAIKRGRITLKNEFGMSEAFTIRPNDPESIDRLYNFIEQRGLDPELFAEEISKYDPSYSAEAGTGDSYENNEIKVIAPNGDIGFIPAEQLEDALSQGYREVQ